MAVKVGRRAALAGGGALLLTGCESLLQYREMRPGFAFGTDPALGGIVGTIETAGPMANGGGRAWVTLAAQDVLEPNGWVRRGVTFGDTDRTSTPDGRYFNAPTALGGNDFTTAEGTPVRLFAAALPERDYIVSAFTYQQFGLRVLGTTVLPQTIRVRPRAGTVLYIGNLVFVPNIDTRVRAIALRDRSERDLPRLREQFDWLRERPIEVAVPQAPGWPQEITIPPA